MNFILCRKDIIDGDIVEGIVMVLLCVLRGLLRKNYKLVVFKDFNKFRFFFKMVILMLIVLL